MKSVINCFKFYFIAIILLMLLAYSCSENSKSISDDDKQRLLIKDNKIANITEFKTVYLTGMQQKEQISKKQFFNKDGYKIYEENYKDDGTLNLTIYYTYENNRLIVSKGLNADSTLLFNETRSYFENGNRKELIFYLPDGTYKYRNVATYDNNNKMTELAWYWPEGLKAINKFKYDGNRKTEDAEYGPDGKFRYKWKYVYDNKGNLIKSVQYNSTGNENASLAITYNTLNQKVSEESLAGSGLKSKCVYEYNENKLVKTKTELSALNNVSARYRYEYTFQ